MNLEDELVHRIAQEAATAYLQSVSNDLSEVAIHRALKLLVEIRSVINRDYTDVDTVEKIVFLLENAGINTSRHQYELTTH